MDEGDAQLDELADEGFFDEFDGFIDGDLDDDLDGAELGGELEEFPDELVLEHGASEAGHTYNDRPRRRRGGWIGAGLLGVEQALYGVRKTEVLQVADADGMPEPDFDVNLTPDPRDSTVVLRKHWRRRSAGS